MGISLQQHRAAIGNWHAGRNMISVSLPSKDQHLSKNYEEEYLKIASKGLWEITIILLYGLTIALTHMNNQQSIKMSFTPFIYDMHNNEMNFFNLDNSTGDILPLQCQKALLIIAGVEQNPGPTQGALANILRKQEEIVAELSSNAPNTDIRDCLRHYNIKNSIRQHKAEFGKCDKAILVTTLDYLGVPGQNQFTKPACINEIICRIQNLLPDRCNLCEAEYCVKRDEVSLLICAVCGQGSHNICILNHLELQHDDSLNPQQAMEKINPTKLSGFHYLCGSCEENIIPDKEAGRMKRQTANGNEMGNIGSSQQTPDENQGNSTVEASEDVEQEVERPLQTEQPSAPSSPPSPNPSRTICPHYKKNTCRYGIAGRGCPNEHPKPCKKFIQHGIKSPNGCSLGRNNCDKFHPKMCHTSLTKGVCFVTDCKSRHVTGTKRTQTDVKDVGHENKTGTPKTKIGEKSSDFLEVLNLLKVEMLEAMDTKIAQYISVQASAPTTGNYLQTPSTWMKKTDSIPYMNQGSQGILPSMGMQSVNPWGVTIPGQPMYPQVGMNQMTPVFMPLRAGTLSY